MLHPWRHLNLDSKHIFLNIRMIAAVTLNTCTAPFPSASAELRRFINRLIIIIKIYYYIKQIALCITLLIVIISSLSSVLSLAIIRMLQIGPSYQPEIFILLKDQQPITQSTCRPKGYYRSLIAVTQL